MRERIRQIHWYLLPRQDVNGCTRKSAEFYTFGREISYPRAVVNDGAAIAPFRLWLPVTAGGMSAAGYLCSVLCSVRWPGGVLG